jgi:hypothetical protein
VAAAICGVHLSYTKNLTEESAMRMLHRVITVIVAIGLASPTLTALVGQENLMRC